MAEGAFLEKIDFFVRDQRRHSIDYSPSSVIFSNYNASTSKIGIFLFQLMSADTVLKFFIEKCVFILQYSMFVNEISDKNPLSRLPVWFCC